MDENKHTYTKVGNVICCDDCGSYTFGDDGEEILHFFGCVPGESEKWKKYYENNPVDDNADDASYEEYLKNQK